MNIAFPHKPQKHGGPGSFQMRLEKTLKDKGWNISYFDETDHPDLVMVIGGTKKLWQLIRFRLKGVPVIFRLDGINWLHKKVKVSLWGWFYNEVTNFLSQIIRLFISNHIIYQSKFVEEWWKKKGWKCKTKSSVIHNGVSLNEFKPSLKEQTNRISLFCVEGNLDYSPYSLDLLNKLQEELIEYSDFGSLILYGSFNDMSSKDKLNPSIDYRGHIHRSEISNVYRNGIYLSLDVNAACPNTVIEALASGIPVIGFDTGALKELVTNKGGIIVPYGSDPWELEFPDFNALCEAATKVMEDWDQYSKQARILAEEMYNLDDVVDKYLNVIEESLKV